MILRVEFFVTIFVYYITGIHTQNPSCRLIDFNYTDSVFEFDECFFGNLFTNKSYAEGSLVPFRNDSVNYLSNFVPGFSCFASSQLFNLDKFTEFDVIIYLASDVVFDTSNVEIQVYDTDNGDVFLLGRLEVLPESEWVVFNHHFAETIENAQIEIVAFINPDAVLAIEYLRILNSRKGDEDCDRTTTTTETSTSTTISTTASTTPSPTSTPINSNENSIWMTLSFVFLLITVVVMATSIYMLYLYKTAMKKMPFSATTQATRTGLPRLTVTTSSSGDQVIVGVQKFQSSGFLRS